MKWLFFLAFISPCIYGDVSYNVITKSTGTGESSSSQAKVSIQGKKMVQVSDETKVIIDSSKKTISELNLTEKTYTITTFDQIDQSLEKARDKLFDIGGTSLQEKMEQIQWSFEIKDNGKEKLIDETTCKEIIFTATTKLSSSQSFTPLMELGYEFCLSNAVIGINEINSFTDKYSAINPAQSLATMNVFLGNLDQGLKMLEKKLAEKGGVSLLNKLSFKVIMPNQNPDQPSMELVKMETLTVQSDFSTAAVSSSLFEIPADFRKVEREK